MAVRCNLNRQLAVSGSPSDDDRVGICGCLKLDECDPDGVNPTVTGEDFPKDFGWEGGLNLPALRV